MVFFNWATMQMAAKIVYYGPGLCGKTTNLSYIYAKTSPGSRGEMVSLETETDRTLFFDLLPLEVGKVAGFKTRLQLYTVPGQVFYNTTRKLVLKGVDGVVFVADSQRPMADANTESFHNLEENLAELGISLTAIPVVLQYNKRDLKSVLSVDELNATLNPEGRFEFFEAVAVDGQGVFETLKAITKTTLKSLRRRMAAQEAAPAPSPAPAPPPVPTPAEPRAAMSFNPAALSAALEEGLGAPPPVARLEPPPVSVVTAPRAEPSPDEITARHTPPTKKRGAPQAETLSSPIEELPPPKEAAKLPPAEEVEEAPVEFATTPEPAAPSAKPEMRHVKVASSLDILAELETLRKSSTFRPTAKQAAGGGGGPTSAFDLDSLLQGSLNSRQEVKRRLDEGVGKAFQRATQCLVKIELVDRDGKSVRKVSPLAIDLEEGERLRQLALNLIVTLQGE